MTGRTQLITAVALAVAGIGAIAGGYAWFPMGSGPQLTLVCGGSLFTAVAMAIAIRRWAKSEAEGSGSAAWWALTDPTASPGCGTILMSILLSIAGLACVILSITHGWDISWGLAITLSLMGGACFGAAIITLRSD